MRIKFLALATLAALTISSAQAETGQAHTWTLHDVVFDDLTTATGTFSVDALANLTSFDITTQQAGDFPGTHYSSADPSWLFGSADSENFLIALPSELESLLINLSGPDNTNVASVGIGFILESYSPLSFFRLLPVERITSSGSITTSVLSVPEPETYALMLAGLGVLGLVARRRNSS